MKTETRRDGTVQLADWWEDLIWPRVLSAAALGVRPSRIGLAFFGMIAVLVLARLGKLLDKSVGLNWWMPRPWDTDGGGEGWMGFVWRMVVAFPVECAARRPFTTAFLILIGLPVLLSVLAAISRLVALEFSRGEYGTWTEGLAFGVARVKSLVGAVLGPLVLVWLIALAIMAGSWLLLSWPYVNLVGAVLYGLALILAIVAALVALAYLVGGCLIVPAVACDGADAIDAVQRAYAYTLDRPVRLLLYYLLAALGLAFVLAVMVLILGSGIGIAYLAAKQWLGVNAEYMLRYATESAGLPGWGPSIPGDAAQPSGSRGSAAWMIRLWTMLPVYLFLSATLSCLVAAKTVVYLGIRRICDGQDTAELWMPGLIEGTMNEALRGRAAVGGATPSGLPAVEADEA